MQPEKIQMTQQELEQHDLAITMQTKLDVLINDFHASRTANDKHFAEIFTLIRNNDSKLQACRNDVVKEVDNAYMTKTAAETMELRLINNFKSIKTWIVTTVGAFTAAGILILWALNVIHISTGLLR